MKIFVACLSVVLFFSTFLGAQLPMVVEIISSIVFVSALFLVFKFYPREGKKDYFGRVLRLLLWAVAIVFNPIYKFPYTTQEWEFIRIAAGFVFFWLFIKLRKYEG